MPVIHKLIMAINKKNTDNLLLERNIHAMNKEINDC